MEFLLSLAKTLLTSPLLLIASAVGALFFYVCTFTFFLEYLANIVPDFPSHRLPAYVPSSRQIPWALPRQNH